MGKGYRSDRLGEEIKKIVSSMILWDLKDPKLKDAMTTVSYVKVTGDGSLATIFLSVLPLGDFAEGEKGRLKKEIKEAEVLEAMKKAKGKIRSKLAKEIKLRYTPELRFEIDKSQDYGAKMDSLIEKATKNIGGE